MRAVILGGGNVGDVPASLDAAERMMASRVGEIVARSGLHESEPWGFEAEQGFVNRAWVVETPLEPEALLDALQAIEEELGRDRRCEAECKAASGARYLSRTMDLDILFCGGERIRTERLTVPHPLIMEREFAIVPACEVLHLTREELAKHMETIEKR